MMAKASRLVDSVCMGLAADLGITDCGHSWFTRSIREVAATRLGAGLLAPTLHHVDTLVLRVSRGSTTVTDSVAGFPTVLLTTTGARSGRPRTVPVGGIPQNGDLAVIGSNFGRLHHPGWVHNLSACPDARVSRHGVSRAVRARELEGEEAEQVWRRARTMYKGFQTYPGRTGGRQIRVFVLQASEG